MKNIALSNTVNTPIYRQLYDQISLQIYKGELTANHLLPSLRTAAKELRISIITVKKAWEELEKDGFIYTVAGKGCFVKENSKSDLKIKLNEHLKVLVSEDLKKYKKLDLKNKELM